MSPVIFWNMKALIQPTLELPHIYRSRAVPGWPPPCISSVSPAKQDLNNHSLTQKLPVIPPLPGPQAGLNLAPQPGIWSLPKSPLAGFSNLPLQSSPAALPLPAGSFQPWGLPLAVLESLLLSLLLTTSCLTVKVQFKFHFLSKTCQTLSSPIISTLSQQSCTYTVCGIQFRALLVIAFYSSLHW